MSKIVSSIVGMFRSPTAVNRSANHATSGYRDAQAQQEPYMETGKQANTMLQNQLGSGALGGTFEAGDFEADPGYQFRKEQGEQALDRKSTGPGGGGYFSGQALKEAQQFGQGLADQTYNDAYNRWMGQQKNTYGILSGQQDQGRQAGTAYGNSSINIGNTMAEATLEKERQRQKGLAGIFSGFGD